VGEDMTLDGGNNTQKENPGWGVLGLGKSGNGVVVPCVPCLLNNWDLQKVKWKAHNRPEKRASEEASWVRNEENRG
jgi:hypothetical protein